MILRAWQLARIGLIALMASGAALSAALALGAADPPRHALLRAETHDPSATLALPHTPFTLIAQGLWSAEASPLNSWHLVFTAADGAPAFSISLHGDASFAVAPFQTDAIGFIHLRRPPESNEIWLYWDGSEATLRLNRELAWRGQLPRAAQVSVRGTEGLRSIALRLYTP